MKKVKTERFQVKKPEKISFQPDSLDKKSPTPKPKSVKPIKKKTEQTKEETSVQTNGRTDEQINERSVYLIKIPIERRKIRNSFDIFEDQMSALNKIQLAEIESGGKKKPALGDMIQKALDNYIKEKVEQEENIKISYEQANEPTDERTNVRPQ